MPQYTLADLERYLASNNSTNHAEASEYDGEFDEWPPADAELAWFTQDTGQETAHQWLSRLLGPSLVNESLTDLLTSPASDEAASERLADLLGFERLDVIPTILAEREALRLEELPPPSLSATASSFIPHQSLQSKRQPNAATNGYMPGRQAQIIFRSEQDIADVKKQRSHARKMAAANAKMENRPLTLQEMQEIRQQALEDAANNDGMHLRKADDEVEQYPHVYTNRTAGGNLTAWGDKFSLPVGTTHDKFEVGRSSPQNLSDKPQKYEEITIPAQTQAPPRAGDRLIQIDELDELARGSFPGYKTLNRLQSLVYEVAYKTNENMLVCAPTGAGKTDVAVLTLLRTISQHAELIHNGPTTTLSSKNFKIVYVAPMKALAAEIVRKMTKRLTWLGVQVRELTGDMQLSRSEIAKTQMIVTTPEKWAVVTNKPSAEGDLASQVKLLIIDEVHLLHDERGAVIETLVARTLRQVESSQGLIRIVGLSATLPNYVDVADFLGVNRYQGLFYFDSSFRPVPLEQHFIGVKGKAGSATSRQNLDEATFDKVSQLIQDGHQVMVFVHARKETVKTAQTLRDRAAAEGLSDLFDPADHPRYESFKRDMATSRNREMKELYSQGFGIHHAGMLRADRNITERCFEAGLTKVLVCTATLAWGVNLPAYAVVIKGTQVYDAGKGAFTDLSILDVLQIFGRAGRPQYESLGVGYICTSADKVNDYVAAIMHQVPIESKFVQGILDALNAEIVLGTVRTIDEGVRWLGYTFLYVRMRKNPMVYGMSANDVIDDPSLGQKRYQLMTVAAKQLALFKMVDFDQDTGLLRATSLGSIAAKYYLKSASIELFNDIYKPKVTEADALHVLSQSTEFAQIVVRDNELVELGALLEKIPCEVKDGVQAPPGKVNTLLQSYISRYTISDFALISDSAYVAQNAARIARSLFEIALSKEWPNAARVFLAICKSIEKRMWPFDHPLRQCDLKAETLFIVESNADDWTIADLAHGAPEELAKLLRVDLRIAKVVKDAAKSIPRFRIKAVGQPLASDLMRVTVDAKVDFTWSEKLHHSALTFWLILSDEQHDRILQHAFVTVTAQMTTLRHVFTFGFDSLPDELTVNLIPNDWISDEEPISVPLNDIFLPRQIMTPQSALDVPFETLRSSLNNLNLDLNQVDAFSVSFLHSLLFTNANVCISTPSFDHQILALRCALQRASNNQNFCQVLILTATQQAASVLDAEFTKRPVQKLNIRTARTSSSILEWPTDSHSACVVPAHLLFDCPPSIFTALSRTLTLIVATEVQQLNPEYELTLALLQEQSQPRLVSIGAAVQNSTGLAKWLDCQPNHTFSFRPRQMVDQIETFVQAFPAANARVFLHSVIRPAFATLRATRSMSACVCTGRVQATQTASLLVKQLAGEVDSEIFIADREMLAVVALQLEHSEPEAAEALLHGVVLYFTNMRQGARALLAGVLRTGAARLLVTTKDDIFTRSFSPSTVIILGTRYMAGQQSDVQQIDYSADLLLRLRDLAVGPERACYVMCQTEQAQLYSRVLNDGFFLESQLLESEGTAVFTAALLARINSIVNCRRQHLMQFISQTFLSHQLDVNPSFYKRSKTASLERFLSQLIDERLLYLGQLCLVVVKKDDNITISELGKNVIDRPASIIDQLDRLQLNGKNTPQNKKVKIDLAQFTLTQEALMDYVGYLPHNRQTLTIKSTADCPENCAQISTLNRPT